MVIPQKSHKHPIRNPIGITQKSCRNSQRTSIQKSHRNSTEILQKPHRNRIGIPTEILQKSYRNPIEIPQKSHRNLLRNPTEILQEFYHRIPIDILTFQKHYRNPSEFPWKSFRNPTGTAKKTQRNPIEIVKLEIRIMNLSGNFNWYQSTFK